MTPGDLVKTRKSNRLSQAKLGKMLGYSRVAVNTWENGRYQIPSEIESKLTELGITILPDDSPGVKAYIQARIIFPDDHARCLKHLKANFFNHEFGPGELTSEDKAQIIKLYPDILTASKT